MPDFGIMRGFNEKLFGDKLIAGQLPTQLGLIGSSAFGFKGILDDYPNAAAAYSLRGLRFDYTGNLIRVRRSSDNAEQDIGFTNDDNRGLDTSALASFCSGTNGFVTTWYDQSGNARNLTQTTASSQLQIVSSGSVLTDGGNPCISSLSGLLTMSRTWGISASNPQLFYVGKITTAYGFDYTGHWIDFGNTVIYANHFISSSGDAGTYQDIFNTSRLKYGTFNANLNQRYLECYENISTTTTRYLNGTNRGSNSFTVTTPDNLIIGGFTSYPSTGTIQEIIIYSNGNSSNRASIESNINTYYGIY